MEYAGHAAAGPISFVYKIIVSDIEKENRK